MPLQMGLAHHTDASQIARIHMAALGANPLLRAQFPSPTIRQALEASIEEKTIAEINDPRTTVLVVRHICGNDPVGGSKVIAFAKWYCPVFEGEDYVETPWNYPEGTDHAVLDAWTCKAQHAQEVALGGTPCYVLPYIVTDVSYQRRGAGSMLMRWGIEQSKATGVPLYLESTLESAPFYEQQGLTAMAILSLDLVKPGCDRPEVYEEIAYIYKPSELGSSSIRFKYPSLLTGEVK